MEKVYRKFIIKAFGFCFIKIFLMEGCGHFILFNSSKIHFISLRKHPNIRGFIREFINPKFCFGVFKFLVYKSSR